MNSKLKNSPWVLCPSKSFPGSFYYFNVTTGETAWSGDSEKNTDRRGMNFQNVADGPHSYLEPDSPLADYVSPDTSTSSLRYHYNPHTPKYPKARSPTFNQALFPQFMPPQLVPNIVWTPFQMAPTVTKPYFFEKQRRLYYQDTQTRTNIFRPTSPPYETFKPNPNIPPSFLNKKSAKNISNSLHNNFNSKPNIQSNPYNKRQFQPSDFSNLVFKEPLSKKIRLISESNKVRETIEKREEFNPLFKNRFQSLSDPTSKQKADQHKPSKELEYTDLRHVLLARRRQSVNVGEIRQKPVMNERSQFSHDEAKKKVTFDLVDVSVINGGDDGILTMSPMEEDTLTPTLDMKYLSNLSGATLQNDNWYILPDLEVLFQHFDFLKQFVQSDPRCLIFIPISVYKAIELQSIGDCKGRPQTIIARNLLRNIRINRDVVFVQEQDSNIVGTDDDILSCCIMLMQQNYHVVLITKDEILNTRAKSLYINTYTINEIIENQKKTILPTFNLKKTHTTQASVKKPDQTINNNNLLKKSNPLYKIPLKSKQNMLTSVIGSKIRKLNINFDQSIEKNKTKEAFIYDTESDVSSQYLLKENQPENSNRESTYKLSKPIANKTKETIMYDSNTESEIEILHNKKKVNTQHNSNKTPLFAPELRTTYNLGKYIVHNKSKSIFDITNAEVPERDVQTEESIEGLLTRFHLKNSMVELRVQGRMEEWQCTLIQIMEDALTEFLLTSKSTNHKLPPPWYLSEATAYIRRLYSKQPPVNAISDTLYEMLATFSQTKGKLNSSMQPADFMRIFGCCTLLIEALQTIHPKLTTLRTAERMLLDLLNLINDPSLDPDPRSLVNNNSNSVYRNDLMEDQLVAATSNYIKKPKEVLKYLVQTYPQWQSYTELINNESTSVESQSPKKNKIICTTGKNLKSIKISNKNTISMTNFTNFNITKDNPKVLPHPIQDVLDHYDNESDNYEDGLDQNVSENVDCENDHVTMRIKDFLNILFRFMTMLHEHIYKLIEQHCYKSESNIREQSDHMYSLVSPIINNLKSIIQRESMTDTSDNSVIVKAGLDANIYRQLLTKCLEQTQILKVFLKCLLHKATIEDFEEFLNQEF